MATRVLHQFPISHYCEKTRWHLDWKGLTYTTRNLLPGVHLVVNRRLGGAGTVPLLVDDGRVVSDSTDIALYLDERYPERSLLPPAGPDRDRVRELEAYFDDTLGPALRRYTYGAAMQNPGMVGRMFFAGYGGLTSRVGPAALGGILERLLRRRYRITEESVRRSEQKLEESVSRLEAELGGDPTRYLVGNALTLADVTAASLLGPLVGAPGSPWAAVRGDAAIEARRDALRARVAGRWVTERYAKDRPPPAA